jgi:hypothetical protein
MGILATGITLLLIASTLLKRALIPRRIGTTPHCRRCNYNLSGLTADPSAHCPECGLPLSPANIVHGERPRRRLALVTALLLATAGLALTLLPLYAPFRAINWYAYKPTFWLLSDLESSDPGARDHAWTEITARDANHRLSDGARARFDALLIRLYTARSDKLPPAAPDYLLDRFRHLTPDAQTAIFHRLLPDLVAPRYTFPTDSAERMARLEASHDLSPEQIAELTETALAAQPGRNPPVALDYLVDYLARRELAGQLTPEQREQFFLACFNPTLEVRPTMPAGEDVPYRISFAGRGPRNHGWARVSLLTAQVDDRPPARLGGSMSGGYPGDASIGSALHIDRPGKHTVKVTIELAAFDGKYPANTDKGVPRWSRRLTQTARVEILPPGAVDVSWIDDPALADPIHRSLSPQNVRASSDPLNAFGMTVRINAPPANLAFEILARDAAGKEHPLGQITAYAGINNNVGINAHPFPPGPGVGHIDLIFRSSEKVMKSTPDLYQAWRGEIMLPDIPVTPER